uniref:Uncharacterized protein n=1 Tax=Sipha flava TaxID=143950 RepID=A0A2S2R1R5_9HEMI
MRSAGIIIIIIIRCRRRLFSPSNESVSGPPPRPAVVVVFFLVSFLTHFPRATGLSATDFDMPTIAIQYCNSLRLLVFALLPFASFFTLRARARNFTVQIRVAEIPDEHL